MEKAVGDNLLDTGRPDLACGIHFRSEIMIEKDGRYYQMICDGCDESYNYRSYDFMDVVENARDDGWQAKKVDGDWEHYCPECQ